MEILDIHQMVSNAMKKFTHAEILNVRQLNDECCVAELFHGPTWAFKDYSLMLVGELIEYYMRREQNKHLWLIGLFFGAG